MGLHIFWPASACLTLFVVGVIMILLKYGYKCGTNQPRYTYGYNVEKGYTVEESQVAYERDISFSETVA